MKIYSYKFTRIFTAALILITAQSANAVVVNINSITNNESNPISLSLDAGIYNVTPIGTADGGVYDAWNAWGTVNGCNSSGTGCSNGWLHWYFIDSSEFSEIEIWDGVIYSSASSALGSASAAVFELTSSTLVDFYIKDGINGNQAFDNVGGISLNVGPLAAVPVPAAVWLFGTGLLGLIGFSKRRKAA